MRWREIGRALIWMMDFSRRRKAGTRGKLYEVAGDPRLAPQLLGSSDAKGSGSLQALAQACLSGLERRLWERAERQFLSPAGMIRIHDLAGTAHGAHPSVETRFRSGADSLVLVMEDKVGGSQAVEMVWDRRDVRVRRLDAPPARRGRECDPGRPMELGSGPFWSPGCGGGSGIFAACPPSERASPAPFLASAAGTGVTGVMWTDIGCPEEDEGRLFRLSISGDMGASPRGDRCPAEEEIGCPFPETDERR